MHARRIFLAGLVAVGLAAPAPVPPARATGGVLYVTTALDEYDLVANATCSLREAITAVNSGQAFGGCPAGAAGDTILLQPGVTYTLTRTGNNEDNNVTGDLDIRQSLTLTTTGGAAATLAGGAGWNDRLLDVQGTSEINLAVNVSWLVIRGGDVAGLGGGVNNNYAELDLTKVELRDNFSSLSGGGLANNTDGTVTLVDSLVAGNTAAGTGPAGGGVFNYGELSIANSSVVSNTASNPTGQGGGLVAGFKTTLRNVTLSHNIARADGGGLYLDPAGFQLILNNVTITANTADSDGDGAGDGGGVYLVSSGLILSNSLIAGNFDASAGVSYPDCARGGSQTATSQDHNLIGDLVHSNCVITPGPDDQFGTASVIDPQLAPLSDNGGATLTHALLDASPARDAGNPEATGYVCETEDQRGLLRPSPCDVGAYEVGALRLMYLPVIQR